MINTITGIISLSSLDKKKIAEMLHLDQAKLTNDGLLNNLDGVAFSAIFILLLVVVLALGIYFGRNSPKFRSLLLKITNVIFWNFLIRYV
jgi:hypothetical protein